MATQTMRALTVVPGTKKMSVRTIPVPSLDTDDTLVRITRVGFTRRDRLILENPQTVLPDDAEYIIPGHIAVGRVVETGPLVRDLQVGDIVVPTIRRDCNKCIDARSDLCPHPERYMDSGLTGAHGFAREFISMKSRYLVKVPEELEEQALLLAPLSVAEKAHSEALEIAKRFDFYCYHDAEYLAPRALVSGIGPVGIMTTYLLSLYNYRITVFCRRKSDDDRSIIFEPLEVEYINTSRVPLDRLEKAGYSFRHIFETTGDPAYIIRTIPLMSSNAVMVLMAMPESLSRDNRIDIDAGYLFGRMISGNQVIIGSIKSGRDAFESAVKHLVELNDLFGGELSRLVTHTYPLEEYEKILALKSRDTILPVFDLT